MSDNPYNVGEVIAYHLFGKLEPETLRALTAALTELGLAEDEEDAEEAVGGMLDAFADSNHAHQAQKGEWKI